MDPPRELGERLHLVAVKSLSRYALLIGSGLLGVQGLLVLLLLLVLVHQDVGEPGVLQSVMRADPQLRPQLQHPLEKIDAGGIDCMEEIGRAHV